MTDDVAVKSPGEGPSEEVEHVPTAEEATAVIETKVEQAARPGWRTRIVEQPTLVLLGVFAVLYAVTVWQDDSLLETGGIRSILLLACPLAIFAASQTLCMLTGGIDLSIAMTANLAAYVAATESGRGTVPALLLALSVGLAVGSLRWRLGLLAHDPNLSTRSSSTGGRLTWG